MYNIKCKAINYDDLLFCIEYLLEEHPEIKSNMTLSEALSLVSICCITQSDRVLLACPDTTMIAFILSYLYFPDCLLLMNKENSNSQLDYYNEYLQILLHNASPSSYTLLKVNHISHIKNNCFDVILSSYYTNSTIMIAEYNSRFEMILGEEYTAFLTNIEGASKKLKHGGRLLILTRICWILTIWEKLETYQLQLEYQEYHYYLQPEGNPNRFVWLRFSYQKQGVDIENQKRNIQLLMSDNNIDRLYAHRNNCLFPYAFVVNEKEDSYVSIEQNQWNLQYFFTAGTTKELTALCQGYTACLVVPSIALCAYEENRNIVLFEIDNRFRQNGTLKYVKYDLNKGLNSLTVRKYGKKFDTLICDPPFNISLTRLATNVQELISNASESRIYIIYPRNRRNLLVNAFKTEGFYLYQEGRIAINYARPPKLVRMEGKDAIQLYEFRNQIAKK